jgi:hypothetical protein
MNRFCMTCGIALLFAACVVMLPLEAYGQKKKAPPKKTEEAVDAPAPAATPAPAPAPAAPQLKSGASLKEVLMKYKGEKTNLGVLTKVEGDYFVTDEKGVMTYRAIGAIVSIEVSNADAEEEDSGPALEIHMIR